MICKSMQRENAATRRRTALDMYLNAGTNERNWFVAGLEFGINNVGKPVLIVKALYGLHSSGAQWREHMVLIVKALYGLHSSGAQWREHMANTL